MHSLLSPRVGIRVSIPFKREGTSGHEGDDCHPECYIGFNSLQTGRYIWTYDALSRLITDAKFQFPSNGKVHLDALWNLLIDLETPVSIPFKREGTSGRGERHPPCPGRDSFQFPSNGKVHLDRQRGESAVGTRKAVSIPFKREGTSGLRGRRKAAAPRSFVSIPFKREGTSGLEHESLFRFYRFCFNSLQTGRYIWTPPLTTLVIEQAEMPKSKRDLYKLIFDHQFPPKMPENPDGH